MTNNPMLSVERELLEALHSHPDCPVEFIDHLRRAISQPAGNAFKRCTILKECSTSASATTAAAQHQGEPVAQVASIAPFFYALMGPDGKPYYEEICVSDEPYHLECVEDGVTVVPLYLKPAPVAVVMPERMDPRDQYDSEANQWNACLDEVARLNGVKP